MRREVVFCSEFPTRSEFYVPFHVWCRWIFKGRKPPHCLSLGGSLNCRASFSIPCTPAYNPWGYTRFHTPLHAQPSGANTVQRFPVCTYSPGHTQCTLHTPSGHKHCPAYLCAHTPEGTQSTHCTLVCTSPEDTHSTLHLCVHTPLRAHTVHTGACVHTFLRAYTPEGTHFFPGLLPQLKIFPNTLDRNCSWSLCWQFKSHTFHPNVRSKCIPGFIMWDFYTLRLICFEAWTDPGQAHWKWALSVLQTPSISLAWLSSKSCS